MSAGEGSGVGGPGARHDGRRPVLPPAFFLGAVFLMVALRIFVPLARLFPPPWGVLGAFLIAAGGYLNVRCSRMFEQRQTTIKPFEETAELVLKGPYRFSRNPMYLGLALILCGIGVALGALSPFFVIPPFIVLMNVRFIGPEERALVAKFGDEYRAYRQRVRRWI